MRRYIARTYLNISVLKVSLTSYFVIPPTLYTFRLFGMPLWSIADWRARIGGSWCVTGRPICKKNVTRRQSKRKSQFIRLIMRVLCGCITSLLVTALTTLVLYTGPSLTEMSDCKLIMTLSELNIVVSHL